ncbi:hypothetical protein J6590_007286 [Homalodisca vitripennis]|nr:hypothetical protein J6590_007286 [Homalodisca vitripennis]
MAVIVLPIVVTERNGLLRDKTTESIARARDGHLVGSMLYPGCATAFRNGSLALG